MDFRPYVIDLFLYEDLWKMIFWLVLKLERLVIELSFLKDLGFF
jgi:hypothetical protein